MGGGGAAAAAAGMLGSSIRPGSMAERARLANIPLPETALKCPRCESTNTKFCYFNNYSLTQPRHFCKTCRRYWTRGGALRNVPVGGGCRRNKRSSSSSNKSSNSSNNNKSPVSSAGTNNNSSSTSSTATVSPTANILGLLNTQQIPPLRFLSPLSQLSQHDHYNTSSSNPGGGGDIISLNYNGISGAPAAALLGSTSSHEMNFHNQLGSNNFLGLGGGCTSAYNSLLSSNTSIEPQWRLPFPNLLGGLDSSGLYHQFQGGSSTTTTSNVEPSSGGGGAFGGGGGGTEMSHDDQVRPSNYKLSSSMLTQMASIKMEDMNPYHHHQHHELNLSRQLMGNIPNNNNDDNQWSTGGAAGTSAWTDLSSFSSSSTSNPL